MASAYVPSPPEEDFLGFSTQQENSLSQVGSLKPYSQVGQFGGDGFVGSTTSALHYSRPRSRQGSRVSSVRQLEEMQPQRAPVTPATTQPRRVPMTEECRLNFSYDAADEPSGRANIGLRSVNEIPEMYRSVFKNYSHFNLVQSKVFDDVMYTDRPLVTSAPTGSGKTVIFELAIIRLLVQLGGQMASAKIIYVAPIKALCAERFDDWQTKFGPLGLRCCELTGDSQLDDYFELQNAQIVMTTPEKWDSMTRKWRDHKSLVQLVRLFLIDEVHQLNDETRGPTMEAIVSRMKTIRSSLQWEGSSIETSASQLRFIAVSATMPNISDVAAWLGSSEEAPALEYAIDESYRPVRLRKVVLGYPNASTEFKFDLSLNYRLSGVIQCYSEQKPSLVFCATRKGTQQAANVLIKDARFVMNGHHKQRLVTVTNSLKDAKLRELVMFGVGYHHAGMDVTDRKAVETLFTAGELPVLFATSTLAMGVNLPAHLVVIKSTMHYITGMFQECSESQVLQMIGRAGRPQFDTTATAVIMTRNSTKIKYEALLGGTQLIESSLHHHLIEHMNAEIVLHTITDVSVALEWLRSTFFYIRVKQNPQHYGLPQEQEKKEEKLQQLCLEHLHLLEEAGLVRMEDGFTLQPTETGRLMARYYVAFESMKRFLALTGREDLSVLVSELSKCREFEDVRLRMNERKVLNTLNKDKNRQTIRFPMNGKIKTTDMKVDCLIQANLGCLPVQEFGLNQDTQKIIRGASRLSKCLMELEMLSDNFECLLNAVLLNKCFHAKLWENSKYVSRQLDKIGISLSTALVNAGLTSFNKIKQKTPRELELIMNRHPPFGNQVLEAISRLPAYSLSVEQSFVPQATSSELVLHVRLSNHEVLKERGPAGSHHSLLLLVGDQENKVICRQRLSDSQMMGSGHFTRKLTVQRSRSGDDLRIHVISMDLVGLDIQEVYTPRYTTVPTNRPPPKTREQENLRTGEAGRSDGGESSAQTCRKACSHRCVNKAVCGHECCKVGIAVKSRPLSTSDGGSKQAQQGKTVPNNTAIAHSSTTHARTNSVPSTPRMKFSSSAKMNSHCTSTSTSSLSSRFGYTPKPSLTTTPGSINQPKQHQTSYDTYQGASHANTDYSAGYSGAQSPPSRNSNVHGNSGYRDNMYGADFDPSDIDADSVTRAENLSANVDMSEWFNPDIAYFAAEDKVAECTSSKKSTLNRPKKQSAASQMREMSLRLGREQAGDQSASNTVQRLPVMSGLSGRKRLIDNMFDEIFDPKGVAQPPTKKPIPRTTQANTILSIKSTPQISMHTPQRARKPQIEDSFCNVPDTPRVAASTRYTDTTLSKNPRFEDSFSSLPDTPRVVASTRYTDTTLSKKPRFEDSFSSLPDSPRVVASTRYTDTTLSKKPQFEDSFSSLPDTPRVAASTRYTDATLSKKSRFEDSFSSLPDTPRVAASTRYTDATLSKKPRIGDSFSNVPDTPRVAASTQCTDATLSKKLSSQMQQAHNHTDACSHTMLEQSYEGNDSFISSLYDPESEGKTTSSTSFFTAGPVCNEEEDDVFSSVFAGIF